jgi:predicted RND superfamily exporter protein
MDRFARVVAERPGWVLAVVVAVTVVALGGIVDFRTGRIRIEIDPSVERLLPEGDEARVFYDRIQRTFGSDATLLVGIQDDDLFTPEKLARIEKLTRRLEEIDAVESVLSLATASKIRGVEGDLDVSPFLDPMPGDAPAAARLRDEVLATPVYAGTLVSPDGRATGLLVQFRAIPDSELIRRGIDREVLRIAEEEAAGSRVWIGGNPLVKAQLSRGIQGDLEWIVPAVFVESSILLAFAFRSASAVVLPLLGS